MSSFAAAQPSPGEIFGRVIANIEKVMRGQRSSIRKLLAAFTAGGRPTTRHDVRKTNPQSHRCTSLPAAGAAEPMCLKRFSLWPAVGAFNSGQCLSWLSSCGTR